MDFNFDICYRPGTRYKNADALSRMTEERIEELPQTEHHAEDVMSPDKGGDVERQTGSVNLCKQNCCG